MAKTDSEKIRFTVEKLIFFQEAGDILDKQQNKVEYCFGKGGQ